MNQIHSQTEWIGFFVRAISYFYQTWVEAEWSAFSDLCFSYDYFPTKFCYNGQLLSYRDNQKP